MNLLFMAHAVGMGVGGQPAPVTTGIWYFIANTRAVK